MNDCSHTTDRWSLNMMFYYSAMVMDRYSRPRCEIGIFRNSVCYGPAGRALQFWIHPYRYKDNWHLALVNTPSSSLYLINCSPTSEMSFDIDLEAVFCKNEDDDFLQVVRKLFRPKGLNKLRPFSVVQIASLFNAISRNNAVNVLAIVYSMCCSDTFLRCFEGQTIEAMKFDATAFYTREFQSLDRNLIEKIALGSPFYFTLVKRLEIREIASRIDKQNQAPDADPKIALTVSRKRSAKFSDDTERPGKKLLRQKSRRTVSSRKGAVASFDNSLDQFFLPKRMALNIAKSWKIDMIKLQDPELINCLIDLLQRIFSVPHSMQLYDNCKIICKKMVYGRVGARGYNAFQHAEQTLLESLKIDSESQLIPVCVNQCQICLIEFKCDREKDFGDTTVNILEIQGTLRKNRFSNYYSLRKLVEIYTFHFNRKIVSIQTRQLLAPRGNLLSMIMTLIYLISYSIKNKKFVLNFKPNKAKMNAFYDQFVFMNNAINNNDEIARNNAFRKWLSSLDSD